jgi:hypothetical protein
MCINHGQGYVPSSQSWAQIAELMMVGGGYGHTSNLVFSSSQVLGYNCISGKNEPHGSGDGRGESRHTTGSFLFLWA